MSCQFLIPLVAEMSICTSRAIWAIRFRVIGLIHGPTTPRKGVNHYFGYFRCRIRVAAQFPAALVTQVDLSSSQYFLASFSSFIHLSTESGS